MYEAQVLDAFKIKEFTSEEIFKQLSKMLKESSKYALSLMKLKFGCFLFVSLFIKHLPIRKISRMSDTQMDFVYGA